MFTALSTLQKYSFTDKLHEKDEALAFKKKLCAFPLPLHYKSPPLLVDSWLHMYVHVCLAEKKSRIEFECTHAVI